MEQINTITRESCSPPKLGGVRGGLNNSTHQLSHRHNILEQKLLRQTLRNNATTAEAVLWRRLKGKQINGLKFRRQFSVGPYVIDFYCPELKLGIELDGEIHNTQMGNAHDKVRDFFLKDNNISILRYENQVVFKNVEAIVYDISEFQKNTKRSDHP